MIDNLIFVVSLLGFLFSLFLISKEKKNPGYCPEFSFVPACHIVAFAFVFILISRILTLNWLQELFFWSGSAIGLILGVWFSFHDSSGKKICPRFFSIPLCYISSFVFLLLIIFRLMM